MCLFLDVDMVFHIPLELLYFHLSALFLREVSPHYVEVNYFLYPVFDRYIIKLTYSL